MNYYIDEHKTAVYISCSFDDSGKESFKHHPQNIIQYTPIPEIHWFKPIIEYN